MMMNERLHETLNTGIYPKCAATVTELKTWFSTRTKNCFYNNFFGKIPDYTQYLNILEKWQMYAFLSA